MIWMFLLQLLLAVSGIILLRIQRVRNYLMAAAALAGRITVHTANVLFLVLLGCLIGVAIISLAFFVGLLIRACGLPEAGNFIITAVFLVVAIPLGIIAVALTAITGAAGNAIFRARQTLAMAIPEAASEKPSWSEVFARLKEQFPDQAKLLSTVETASTGWLASLFDTTGIKAILSLPHTIVFDTVEAVSKAVGKMGKLMAGFALATATSGFISLIMPDSASAFLLFVLVYALLLLLFIAGHKGKKWRKAHNLADPWWVGYNLVRWISRGVVAAIIFTAVYVAVNPSKNFSHWMVGAANAFRITEEETAKDFYGPRFDQNTIEVRGLATAYPLDNQGRMQAGRLLTPGTKLWKTTAIPVAMNGMQFGTYLERAKNGAQEPDITRRVMFPESMVQSIGISETTRMVSIPQKTKFRIDTNGDGRPEPQDYDCDTDMAAQVTAEEALVSGHRYTMCLRQDDPKFPNYPVWVEETSLASLPSL